MASHTLHDCYNAILRAAQAAAPGTLIQYAASYAKVGLTYSDAAVNAELTNVARTQALYVRSNLSTWRGQEAQAVRRSMDKILTPC